jgi:hypothetical protein
MYTKMESSCCSDTVRKILGGLLCVSFFFVLCVAALAYTSWLCKTAPFPGYDASCPANGDCSINSQIGSVNLYQGPCSADSNNVTAPWCIILNCTTGCAQYVKDCSTEQVKGVGCVPPNLTQRRWCSSRMAAKVGFGFSVTIASILFFVIIILLFVLFVNLCK